MGGFYRLILRWRFAQRSSSTYNSHAPLRKIQYHFFFFNIANCAAGTLAGLAKGIQWWFDILLEDVLLTILKESRQSVCTCVLCLEAAMLLYVQNLTFNCSHACQGVYGNEFSSYCRRTDPVTWCLCHRCVSRSTFQVEPGSHAPLRTKLNF